MQPSGVTLMFFVLALLTAGCTRYSADKVDRVLLFEDGHSRLRDLWRVELRGPKGTSGRNVIPSGEPDAMSQSQLRRLFKESFEAGSPARLQAYADALNPEIVPGRIRWVLGRDPLLIGIGTETPPVTQPAGTHVGWAFLVRDRDTGRQVEAVLEYEDDLQLQRRGTRDASSNGSRGSATFYRLGKPMTLGMIHDMLDAYGTAFLRSAAAETTRIEALLDEKRL